MANILIAISLICNNFLLLVIFLHINEIRKTQKQKKEEEEYNELLENSVTKESNVISEHVFKREEEYDKLIADLKNDLYSTPDAKPVKGMTYNIPHDEVDIKINKEQYPDVEYSE